MNPAGVDAGLLACPLAGAAAAVLIWVMLKSGRFGSLDQPNDRSLHSVPVPRSGGVGVLLAVFIGLAATQAPPALDAAVAMVALISWLDDQYKLPILLRLAVHVAAALLIVWDDKLFSWGPAAALAAVLACVWMINLFNFMDGSDGLAGGMALIGFAAYAVAAGIAGAQQEAVRTACIAAGAAGFLLFNFHPARIFLGDVGSIPLGFLAAALGLAGIHEGLWPAWFPVLVFAPFIVDATATLSRRAAVGARVWQAHRDHYYQRLVRMGWSHRRLALAEYALMAATAGSAILVFRAPPMLQWSTGLAWLLVFGALMAAIDRRWARCAGTGALP